MSKNWKLTMNELDVSRLAEKAMNAVADMAAAEISDLLDVTDEEGIDVDAHGVVARILANTLDAIEHIDEAAEKLCEGDA